MTAVQSAAAEYKRIPLTQLVESSTNPRKIFDTEDLKELAGSIKETGVIEPIVVRPHAKGFEIVVGARRARASKIAGVSDIPALIRTLSDAQVVTIQLVENLQRKNVRPLEEAAGFAQLLDAKLMGDAVMTAEQIAEKVGKSTEYVYARVKLNDLEKPARDLLDKGSLQTEHGVLIARLESVDQNRAVDFCKHEQPNVKELRQWIDEDVRWQNARKTATDKLAELNKDGQKAVLISSLYSKHSDSAQFVPKRTLFGSDYKTAAADSCKHVVTGISTDKANAGKTQTVCVNEKCKVHSRGYVYTPPAPPSKNQLAKRRKKESLAKLKKKAEELAQIQCIDAVLVKAKFDIKNLQLVAQVVLETVSLDGLALLCKRRGLPNQGYFLRDKLRKLVDKTAKADALQRLILEFTLLSDHVLDAGDDTEDAVYERHNVDRKKIHADVAAQILPKQDDEKVPAAKKPSVQTSTKPAQAKKPAAPKKKAPKPKTKPAKKKPAKKAKRRG